VRRASTVANEDATLTARPHQLKLGTGFKRSSAAESRHDDVKSPV
jgi:hypothetical protein